MPKKAERDDDARPDENEITPEMEESGENVLLGALGGAVSSHWCPRDLAVSVYRAMSSCAPQKAGRSPKRIR